MPVRPKALTRRRKTRKKKTIAKCFAFYANANFCQFVQMHWRERGREKKSKTIASCFALHVNTKKRMAIAKIFALHANAKRKEIAKCFVLSGNAITQKLLKVFGDHITSNLKTEQTKKTEHRKTKSSESLFLERIGRRCRLT